MRRLELIESLCCLHDRGRGYRVWATKLKLSRQLWLTWDPTNLPDGGKMGTDSARGCASHRTSLPARERSRLVGCLHSDSPAVICSRSTVSLDPSSSYHLPHFSVCHPPSKKLESTREIDGP